ncbi:MAG: ATP-binding protein, partial [Fusobacteriaceae bacterium]
MSNNYEASNITVLEGLEAVRKRPGMYIGSTSERGLHHLVWEIIDNSVDEALAGHCSEISVNILSENIIEVSDNGRGIPVGLHPKFGKSALEIVMTVLHAGGKFENDNYKVSGGLHGVGASVVNALSEWMEVIVKRDGKLWFQSYKRGIPVEDVKVIGESDSNGTTTRFKADDTIFETLIYSFDTLEQRLKELAYLNKGLRIIFSDLRKETPRISDLKYDGGILDYIIDIEKNETQVMKAPIFLSGTQDDVDVEISMAYNTSQRETI